MHITIIMRFYITIIMRFYITIYRISRLSWRHYSETLKIQMFIHSHCRCLTLTLIDLCSLNLLSYKQLCDYVLPVLCCYSCFCCTIDNTHSHMQYTYEGIVFQRREVWAIMYTYFLNYTILYTQILSASSTVITG